MESHMNVKIEEDDKDNKIYLKIATEYMDFIFPPIASQILEDTGINNGLCLDIGVGPGLLTVELAKQSNLKLVGIDISKIMIAYARSIVKKVGLENRIEIVEGDVHSLKYPNNYLDLVVSKDSLHYWKDPISAFKEIYRVLKPGGMAYIMDLRRDAPEDIVNRFSEYLGDFFEHFQNTISRSYTIEEVFNILDKTGILDYQVRPFSMSDSTIVNNITHLIKSPVKDPRASELSLVVIIKKEDKNES